MDVMSEKEILPIIYDPYKKEQKGSPDSFEDEVYTILLISLGAFGVLIVSLFLLGRIDLISIVFMLSSAYFAGVLFIGHLYTYIIRNDCNFFTFERFAALLLIFIVIFFWMKIGY